jgi:heme exporter protein D
MDFDAGSYAAFVWPAYGVSALVLLALTADTLLRARRWRRRAEARDCRR